MIIKLLICLALIANESIAKSVKERNDKTNLFREYVQSLKSQINKKVNPCKNFQNYACGNLKLDESYTEFHLENLILLNGVVENDFDSKAKDFLLSCTNGKNISTLFEQIDSLSELDSWPVVKNVTDEHIARLWGELAILKAVDLIEMTMRHNNDVYLISRNPKENVSEIIEMMLMIGAAEDDANEAGSELSDFFEQINLIFNSTVADEQSVRLGRLASLNDTITNFNWQQYFKTFSQSLGIEQEHMNDNGVELGNPRILQKIIDLTSITDSKIIVNYLVWKYVDFANKMKCSDFKQYMSPIVWAKLWKSYFSSTDKANELALLNYFERSYMDIKDQLRIPSDDILYKLIHPRKDLLEKQDEILSETILKKFYGSVQVNETMFYRNAIQFLVAIGEDFVKHGSEGDLFGLYLKMMISGEVDLNTRNKPISYYFSTELVDLWRSNFINHEWPENFTNFESCLTDNQVLNSAEQLEYLKVFSASQQSYFEYLKWLNESGDELKMEVAALEELELSHEKIFWLALAQHQCLQNHSKILPNTFSVTAKYSKQFAEAFECYGRVNLKLKQSGGKKVCELNQFSSLF